MKVSLEYSEARWSASILDINGNVMIGSHGHDPLNAVVSLAEKLADVHFATPVTKYAEPLIPEDF